MVQRAAVVPEWVIERHDAVAIGVYAALDLFQGHGTQSSLSERLNTSKRLIRRALVALEDSGAIMLVKRGVYVLERRVPVSNSELSTGFSTRDPQAEPASLSESAELSTRKAGPTTTREGKGKGQAQTSVVEGSSVSDTKTGLRSAKHVPDDPPKLVLIRGRNLGFDALAASCHADPRTRSGEIVAALNGRSGVGIGIRRSFYEEIPVRANAHRDPELFEVALAKEIESRATIYRRRMRGATLTPTALAKWWFDVLRLDKENVTLTPEEIASGRW